MDTIKKYPIVEDITRAIVFILTGAYVIEKAQINFVINGQTSYSNWFMFLAGIAAILLGCIYLVSIPILTKISSYPDNTHLNLKKIPKIIYETVSFFLPLNFTVTLVRLVDLLYNDLGNIFALFGGIILLIILLSCFIVIGIKKLLDIRILVSFSLLLVGASTLSLFLDGTNNYIFIKISLVMSTITLLYAFYLTVMKKRKEE